MNGLRHELRLFFVALQFFTRVPVPKWVGFDPAWLTDSARHFPAVGACVGAAGALVLAAAAPLTSPLVAAVLSTLATVALTGAFHEDGLADTCDGLGGHVSRERALEIMKDSRIGSYGAVGLGLVLALKVAVLASLPLLLAVAGLVLGHTVSRAAAVVLIGTLAYAGDAGAAKARPLAQTASRGSVGAAALWVAAVVAGLLFARPGWAPAVAVALLLAAAGTWACARCWQRRLGGFTGDTLGATQQVTEVLVLLGVLVALRLAGWLGSWS